MHQAAIRTATVPQAQGSGAATVTPDVCFNPLGLGADLAENSRFYWQMALIRETERRLLSLFQDNQIFGTTHTCLGQEANAVGVVNALDRERDTIWSNHRCHGHFLAYCGQVTKLLAEIMGRIGGVCAGRGGSQHLCWGRFHSSGVQGGLVPLALGTAFAERERGAISAVFIGDGTLGEGTVYEGLNLASKWSLPVLFIVEDNGIAQTTPKQLTVSGSVAARSEPFGIRSWAYSGTDVLSIHDLAKSAVDYVRTAGRPGWLTIETVRLGPHSKGDDTRSEEELARLWEKDPLAVHEPRVVDKVELERRVQEQVEAGLAEAERMPVACASLNR